MYLMTQGIQYSVIYKKFGSYFCLPKNDHRRSNITHEKPLLDSAIAFMYGDPDNVVIGAIEGLLPYYLLMNRLLRHNIAPKNEYATTITVAMYLFFCSRFGWLWCDRVYHGGDP